MFITSLWNRLFRKRTSLRVKSRPISHLWDTLEYDRSHPRFWHDLYWSIRRFFKWNKIFHPTEIFYTIKSFYIRGSRGWADCDTWSLDWYLSGWMPAALRHLKEHKHGVPSIMFEKEDCDEDGNASDEGMKRASARWDAIMDKMIAAFEANRRMDETYEDELGEYHITRPQGVSHEAWKKLKDERHEKQMLLIKRDQLIQEEGLILFAKYFSNLWD
jgi:hypothetical protein